MRLLLILTFIITILQAFRTAIYYLRKDITFNKKIRATIVLLMMIIISYFNLTKNMFAKTIYFTLLLDIYILLSFSYEKLFKKEYISVLSVKNGIDMSDTGIMFLGDNGNIVLMNNVMSKILKELNIQEHYLDNLLKRCTENMDNNYLLKTNNQVYLLKIFNNKEVSLTDITELYKLQEQEKLQNKEIKENN